MEEQEAVQAAVKVYKALGEPTRFKIAQLLAKQPDQCCSMLGQQLKMVAGSTLSHHLKQLSESGLLKMRKEGTFIYYSPDMDVIQKYAPYLLA
ncbi:metalloregulator ArsR/SmtB family transcription factor [Paenibacillus sp. KS-LC4]|uniref:ArsR/SmtB family transcription factor n=1 Tax=Paenibacillus sp. KS-LC4 TaxID=2979727 RepID=UPI0030D1F228